MLGWLKCRFLLGLSPIYPPELEILLIGKCTQSLSKSLTSQKTHAINILQPNEISYTYEGLTFV
jgi:hypothetical protein